MIIISAPVYRRDWILPVWFEHIEKQNYPLEELGFIFEAGPEDEETLEVLFNWHSLHPEVQCFDVSIDTKHEHGTHPEGQRVWNSKRYTVMANLRNNLLEKATAHRPDRYFSLDTDVLLENPDTINILHDLTEDYDAVSPLMFMTPKGRSFPNMMTWVDEPGKRALRKSEYKFGELIKSDIIMAAVMMSPDVYTNVRYKHHRQGEDLGWSHECYLQEYELYNASYIYTPHIMSKAMLGEYLESGNDPRKPNYA